MPPSAPSLAKTKDLAPLSPSFRFLSRKGRDGHRVFCGASDLKHQSRDLERPQLQRHGIVLHLDDLAAFLHQVHQPGRFHRHAEADRRVGPGIGVLEYAQRFVSTAGKHDGLYWPQKAGEDESPLGPLYGGRKHGEGYHGYHFRILTAQGKDAPGGAYDYRIKGRMIAGFALVAWPLRYGDTGVMSFIVSHDGKLYEKDLGPNSEAIARGMTRFNPDSSWRVVGVQGK